MAQQLWQTMTSGLGQTEPGTAGTVAELGDTAVQGWRTSTSVLVGTALGSLAGAMLVKKRKLSTDTAFGLPLVGGLLGFGAVWAYSKMKSSSPSLSGYRMYG